MSARKPPASWPESMMDEWCRLHRLIEELSAVQRRLGTPLEEPDDFRQVRTLGSEISERLDSLRPWLNQVEVENGEPVA